MNYTGYSIVYRQLKFTAPKNRLIAKNIQGDLSPPPLTHELNRVIKFDENTVYLLYLHLLMNTLYCLLLFF